MSSAESPDRNSREFRQRLRLLTLRWVLHDLTEDEFVTLHRQAVLKRIAELSEDRSLPQTDLSLILLGALNPGNLPLWFQERVNDWLYGRIRSEDLSKSVAAVRELDRDYRTVFEIGITNSDGEFLRVIPPGEPLTGERTYALLQDLIVPAGQTKFMVQPAIAVTPGSNLELLDSYCFQLGNSRAGEQYSVKLELHPRFDSTPPVLGIVLILPGGARKMGAIYLTSLAQIARGKPDTDESLLAHAGATLSSCMEFLDNRFDDGTGETREQILQSMCGLAEALRAGDLKPIRIAGESLIGHITQAGPLAVAFFALGTLEYYARADLVAVEMQQEITDLRHRLIAAGRSGDHATLAKVADRLTWLAFREVVQSRLFGGDVWTSLEKSARYRMEAIWGVSAPLPGEELTIAISDFLSRLGEGKPRASEQILQSMHEFAETLRVGDMKAIRGAAESLIGHITQAGPVAAAFFALRAIEYYAGADLVSVEVQQEAKDMAGKLTNAVDSGDQDALFQVADRITWLAFREVVQLRLFGGDIWGLLEKNVLHRMEAIWGVAAALPGEELTIAISDFLKSGLSHNLPQHVRDRLEQDRLRIGVMQWSRYQSDILKRLVEGSAAAM